MNATPLHAGDQIIAAPNGAALLANADDSAQSWNALDLRERAKLEQRLRAICTANGPMDKTKIRLVKGGPDGIYEIKLRTPDLGAYAFKDGKNFIVTHVERRPHNKRTVAEAKRADKIRDLHRSQ